MRKTGSLLVALMILALAVSIMACSSSDEDVTQAKATDMVTIPMKGSPTPSPATKDTNRAQMTDFMKIIPEDAEAFSFIDVAALRADGDLKDLYADISDATDWLAGRLNLVGEVSPSQIRSLAIDDEGTIIASVNIDHEKLKAALEEYSLEKEDYQGAEIWGFETSDDEASAAFWEDLLTIGWKGDVKDCLDVAGGNQPSLYDDETIRDLITRLPGGFMITWENEWFYDDWYDGLLFSGTSMAKGSNNTIAITALLRFESAQDAMDAMEEIEEDLADAEDDNFQKITVTQDQEFLKVTTTEDILDFIGDVEDEQTAEEDAMGIELSNTQLAMAALMADHAISQVQPQSTWTTDMTVTITPDGSLSDYLSKSSTQYYYRWDASGKVYQCVDKGCS